METLAPPHLSSISPESDSGSQRGDMAIRRAMSSGSSPIASAAAPVPSYSSSGKKPVFLFRHRVQRGGLYSPQRKRYILYASDACPFSSRCLAYLSLKNLSEVVTVGMVSPIWQKCPYHSAQPHLPLLSRRQLHFHSSMNKGRPDLNKKKQGSPSWIGKGITTSVHLQHHYTPLLSSLTSLPPLPHSSTLLWTDCTFIQQDCPRSCGGDGSRWGSIHSWPSHPDPRDSAVNFPDARKLSVGTGPLNIARGMSAAVVSMDSPSVERTAAGPSVMPVSVDPATTTESIPATLENKWSSSMGLTLEEQNLYCSCGWAFQPQFGYQDPLGRFETVADIYRLSLDSTGEYRVSGSDGQSYGNTRSSSSYSPSTQVLPHTPGSGSRNTPIFDSFAPSPTGESGSPLTRTAYTLPLLFDTDTRTIVNNSCSDICQMLNSAFDSVGGSREVNLFPREGQVAIIDMNKQLIIPIITSILECGRATSQHHYECESNALFSRLDEVEFILSRQRYLCSFPNPSSKGEIITSLSDCDIRLASVLIRLDDVYSICCRCNRKQIHIDYPHILEWLRDLVQSNNLLHIIGNLQNAKAHYFLSPMNPVGPLGNIRVIPQGCGFEHYLLLPHRREILSSNGNNHGSAIPPIPVGKRSPSSPDTVTTRTYPTGGIHCSGLSDHENIAGKPNDVASIHVSTNGLDVHAVEILNAKKTRSQKKKAARNGRKTKSSSSRSLRSSRNSFPSRSRSLKKGNRKTTSKGKSKRKQTSVRQKSTG